ncbi:MAG: formylglycine-generating enzyme family protein, partial [Chloroflexia bacterium]
GRGKGVRARAWLPLALVSLALVVTVLVLAAAGLFSPRPPTPAVAILPTYTVPPSPIPPTPQSDIGSTRTRAADGMVMVYVPAGEFLMGSSDADPMADSDGKPQHTVYLDAYWIDRTEVTNAQYRRCVEAGACSAPGCWGDSNLNGAEQPVVCVDWHQAQAYCAWAGGRLPTEAEWEKAARGTDGRIYPWGDAFDGSRLNCDEDRCGDGWPYAAPVVSFPRGASPYGALDMAGNVWEWVSDWYDGGYYAGSPSRNPSGPASGDIKVLRGGSWYIDNPASLRAANRVGDDPDLRVDGIGFRCVVAPGR